MADAALRASAAGEPPPAWRRHLPAVLAGTSVADGAAAARAIVLAHPAGLGAAPEADVSAAALSGADAVGAGFHHTLGEAMALAADRDQVARQYASSFATVLCLAGSLSRLLAAGAAREDAITATFLRQLAAEPDTHIHRKHGLAVAQNVQQQAAAVANLLPDPPRWAPMHIRPLVNLHDHFRLALINPGTTADLLVAALFATELDAMQNF